jgi:hypothetical protein
MNKEQTIKIRDNLIKELWEKRKSEIEMKDLSKIFNLSLVHIWRILKVKPLEAVKGRRIKNQ